MSFTQNIKIHPPNWWVGMKHSTLQLMVYGEEIGSYAVELIYPGIKLKSVVKATSPNYLFLNVEIEPTAQPGTLSFKFSSQKTNNRFKKSFSFLERDQEADAFRGFDSSDTVYLITPDRFSNGNPEIDVVEGLMENTVNRKDDYARHGGDIHGIQQHLDYISDMGFTAIWPTPMLINDMPEKSYHGYAITDFYKVDPRFGSLEDYIALSKAMKKKGIKHIMDQVVNHCGLHHWWMKDLPFEDWINYQDVYKSGLEIPLTNHRRTVNQDSYASQTDSKLMQNGWFVPDMPDLNHKNTFLATYMIQNSLWWIEILHLSGIRQDTYCYGDKDFMSKWAAAIMTEYPNFNIVGEEWSYNPLVVGYWQHGSKNTDGYVSNLKTVMDFPLGQALVNGLREEEGWDTGLIKLYEALANDFAYSDPQSLLLFGDNHDVDRIFCQLEEDIQKVRMALSFILIAPRIPQIYYGTELLLSNKGKPGDHGSIRADFPGGWKNDPADGFTGANLNQEQIEIQVFLKKILNYRKESKAIHKGKTIHFAPEAGVYVLFRKRDIETVILILNKNSEPITLDLLRFEEMEIRSKTFINLITGKKSTLGSKLSLMQKGSVILYRKET